MGADSDPALDAASFRYRYFDRCLEYSSVHGQNYLTLPCLRSLYSSPLTVAKEENVPNDDATNEWHDEAVDVISWRSRLGLTSAVTGGVGCYWAVRYIR